MSDPADDFGFDDSAAPTPEFFPRGLCPLASHTFLGAFDGDSFLAFRLLTDERTAAFLLAAVAVVFLAEDFDPDAAPWELCLFVTRLFTRVNHSSGCVLRLTPCQIGGNESIALYYTRNRRECQGGVLCSSCRNSVSIMTGFRTMPGNWNTSRPFIGRQTGSKIRLSTYTQDCAPRPPTTSNPGE